MSPQEYLSGFHNGKIRLLHNAMMDKGFSISITTLRRAVLGLGVATEKTIEIWEDFTGVYSSNYNCVAGDDIRKARKKFLAEKE